MSEARIHLDAQVQVRRDTEANWIAVDPVLRDGEIAYSRDINRIKIGDGAHKWSELKYMLSVDAPDYEDIDLSGYAKKEEVTTLSELLASMWTLDEDGNLVTNRNVIIKKNITIGGDMASDGEGGQGSVTGVTSIVIDDKTYNAVDGKIDLSEAFEGLDVDVDLSDYYTKGETVDLLNTAIAGIDLSGYALKSDVNKAIADLINGAPETLDTLKEVADALAENADVVDALNAAIGNKADKATTLAGYGITDAYTQTVINEKIGKAVSDLDTKYIPVKTWYDELASLIVREGNNVRIKTNIIIDGDQSATGEGGGAVSGITGIKLNGTTYKDENNDGIIDLGTITGGLTSVSWSDVQGRPTKVSEFLNDSGYITSAALVGYATQSWVEGKGYITGIDKSMVASAVGSSGNAGKVLSSTGGDLGWISLPTTLPASDVYAWAKKSSLALADVPDLSSKYLSVNGGTIDGTTTSPLKINTTATDENGINFLMSGASKAWIGYSSSIGAYIYEGSSAQYICVKNGTPYYGTASSLKTLIHSGNSTSYNAGGLAHSNGTVGATVNSSGTMAGVRSIDFASNNLYDVGSNSRQARYIYAGWLGSKTGTNLSFGANNSTHMLINSSGNVLIGSFNDTNEKLQIGSDNFHMVRLHRNKPMGYGASILASNEAGILGYFGWNKEDDFIINAGGTSTAEGNILFRASSTSTIINSAVTMSSTLSVGGNISPKTNNVLHIGTYDSASFGFIHANVHSSGAAANNLWLVAGSSTDAIGIQFARNNNGTLTGKIGTWDATGLYPATNNAYTLGTSSSRWIGIYGKDCNLSGNLVVAGDISA